MPHIRPGICCSDSIYQPTDILTFGQMPGFRPGICCSDSVYHPSDVLTLNVWLETRNLLLIDSKIYAIMPIYAHCTNTKYLASGKETVAQTLYTSPLMSLQQIPGFRPGLCSSDSACKPIDVVTPNAWL